AHLFVLARHGETADNARRVFQGQTGSALNKLGRAQALRLAERIKRAPPDAIYASDLERAAETAGVVAKACGREVKLEPGLREVDVGAWSQKSYEEIPVLFPEEWAAWEAGIDVRRGGGETYAELATRIDDAIARIAAAEPDGSRILIVSHGGSIKSWVAGLLGVSADGLRSLAGISNTGLSVVERDTRGRHRLHSWNDVAHL